MSINAILSGITGISDGGRNTASELRTVLTDITGEFSGTSTQLTRNTASTGVIEYDGLSANTYDNSKFDLGPVKGWIVDNTTDPENPTVISVTYTGSTGSNPSGVTLTYLASVPATYIGLSGSTTNDIVQSNTPFDASIHRDVLILGVVVHSNNVNVNVTNDSPSLVIDPTLQYYDLISSIGKFNISDTSSNIYSPNGANLKIDKTSGNVFARSSNYINDPKNPHIKTLASGSSITFRYRIQDSTEWPDTTDVDPNTYDNGGVTALTPTNKFTVQRIVMFTSNIARIQYGQIIYDSIDDAEASLSLEEYEIEPNMKENGLLRAFIIVKQGATNLSDTTVAKFIEANSSGHAHDTVTGNVHRTEIVNHSSTTLRDGGIMSINGGDNTLLDISAGSGVVVDNTTNPLNPTLTQVSWDTMTGISISNISAETGTYISLDSDANVIEQSIASNLTGADRRTNIFLGLLGHANKTNLINVFNYPVHNLSPTNIFADYALSVGPFSVSGNKLSKLSGTLKLAKTSGRSYLYGGNFQTDNTNPDLINTVSFSAGTLVYATGVQVLGPTSSDVDTQNYDPNGLGVLSALTNPNDVTVHRIYHAPTINAILFQYGQFTYSSKAEARDAFEAEDYVVTPSVSEASYLVAVLITEGTSNGSNLDDAILIPQGKFAGSGGGGGTVDTLQSAYNNSTQPEIVTDATRTSVDFKVGSGSDSDNVITIQNNAGNINAFFTGEGYISGSTVSGNVIISGSTSAPSTSGSTGVAGAITYDSDYLYVCTATNTWKRIGLSGW
jgi:hypothetical protein